MFAGWCVKIFYLKKIVALLTFFPFLKERRKSNL